MESVSGKIIGFDVVSNELKLKIDCDFKIKHEKYTVLLERDYLNLIRSIPYTHYDGDVEYDISNLSEVERKFFERISPLIKIVNIK